MKELNKKGFTLVEVLGVLVIIGILALIVVPRITQYMQNGKDNYNTKLGGQLLLTGKSYFSDNKKDLPTDNSTKKYGYITWDQLDSDKYTTNNLIDSEGRDCSNSYVYVKESMRNPGKYDYISCLICEDGNGNVVNHNSSNAYCNIANWSDETPPTCDPYDDYEFAQYVQIANPNDELSKGGAPGKIIAIEILSTSDSILSSTGYETGQEIEMQTNIVNGSGSSATTERENLKVGIVDENTVHIDVSNMSKDEIAKIDLKPIIKDLFDPTNRAVDNRKGPSIYYVNLIDHATNVSDPSCVSFEVGNNNKIEKLTSGDTCKLKMSGNTVTITELAVDRAISDIYYYNAAGAKVSIKSLLPANTIMIADSSKINPEAETATENAYVDYGYDDGYGFVVPGTSFTVADSELDYIKDLQVDKVLPPGITAEDDFPNPPAVCDFERETNETNDNPPTCTGMQKDMNLSLTITDDNGIRDIYYRDKNNVKQSIIDAADKDKTSISLSKTLPNTAPDETKVTVEDTVGQTKVCEMTYSKTPVPGAPTCTITEVNKGKKIGDIYVLNRDTREKTYTVTCKEATNSALTVASDWRTKLTTTNGKGVITPTSTPANGTTVTFNVKYTANLNTSGVDYFVLKTGLVSTSNGKKNIETKSPKINIDTTTPNIVMTLNSTLKGTLSGESNVYFVPFGLTITCKDSSFPGAKEAKLSMDVKNAGTKNASTSYSSVTNPKTYTVSSFSSSETPYKAGSTKAANVYLRQYRSSCTDAASNSSSKNSEYKVGKAPKSNCEFTKTPTGWQKKGDTPTFKVKCTVPDGNTTLHIADTKNDNGKYKKITTDNALGVVKNCSVDGNNTKALTITCTYAVSNNKSGTDKINIGAGIVETAVGTENTAVRSSGIKVDSIPPVVDYTKDSNDKDHPHHADWTFKIKCSDTGSGVKNISAKYDKCTATNCSGSKHSCSTGEWKTYTSNPKEITKTTTGSPFKYEAYCTDKAGNVSDHKKRNYYVQKKGTNECCGVAHYKKCRNSNCSCALRKRCNKCTCAKWNYKSVNDYKWKCKGKGSSTYSWSTACSSPGSTYYNSGAQCVCKKYGSHSVATSCNTYNRCKSCKCETYNKCEAKVCGIQSYQTCWHY